MINFKEYFLIENEDFDYIEEAKRKIVDPEISELAEKIKRETRRLKLLTVLSDPKTLKSFEKGKGNLTAIMYLMPAKTGGVNACPCATDECEEGCIHYSGGDFKLPVKEKGRMRRTRWLFGKEDANPYYKRYAPTKEGFFQRLQDEMDYLKSIASKYNLDLSIRLNGTSDLNLHKYIEAWMNMNPDVKFYDYTKITKRAIDSIKNKSKVHYTISRSENIQNNKEAEDYLKMGGNVAVVFDDVPEFYRGYKVINGDETDLRFLDDIYREKDEQGNYIGVVVGLKMKGNRANARFVKNLWSGKGPEDGFVVRARELKIRNPDALTNKKTGFDSRTPADPEFAKRLYIKKIKNYMAILGRQSLKDAKLKATQQLQQPLQEPKQEDQNQPTAMKESFIGFFQEACWKNYKQVGMKKKGNKMVPNCVPKKKKKKKK
jgi:hypothetical protein